MTTERGHSGSSVDRSSDRDWVCVGVFQGAHGVRGDIKLRAYTADPRSVIAFKDIRLGADGERVKILSSRPDKMGFVVRLEGVGDRDAAQAMNGRELYVLRSLLPALATDEVYLTDLEGLSVEEDGTRIGTVLAVHNFGAEDLLDLKLDEPIKGYGKSIMVPFRRDLVPEVDVAAGRLVIRLKAWLTSEVTVENEGKDAE